MSDPDFFCGSIDLRFGETRSTMCLPQLPEERTDEHRNASRPVGDLFPSRNIRLAAGVQERPQERIPVSFVERADPDRGVVEDLPEVRGSRPLGPAELAQRPATSGDESEAGLLGQRTKLIPQVARQSRTVEHVVETVEHHEYLRTLAFKLP